MTEATEIGTSSKFVDVELDEPIRRGETTIGKITVRKPSPGEMRGLKLADLLNLDVAAHAKLLARISVPTLTEAEVMGMDSGDFTALAGEAAAFLLNRRRQMEAGLTA